MAESDHSEVNSICYHTVDIRNWSDSKITDEILTSTVTRTWLVKAFIPMIIIVGFVGNAAFFLLLTRVKRMRTITNFYLANLAAADLMFLFLETFYQSWRYLTFKQIVSEAVHKDFGCGMMYFMGHLLTFASILIVTLVSFDRYFAICHPLKYRSKKNKKQVSCILILIAWIISALVCFLRSLASGRLVFECILWPSREKYKYFPDRLRYCKPVHPFFQIEVFEHLVHTAPFSAALITIAIINIKIVQRLTRPPPGENGNQQNQQIKRRITWMLLANAVIFFSCLAPYNCLLVFGRLMNLSRNTQQSYGNTAFILHMINSAINPILYGMVSPSYRKGFLKAFGFSKNQIEPMEEQATEKTTAA